MKMKVRMSLGTYNVYSETGTLDTHKFQKTSWKTAVHMQSNIFVRAFDFLELRVPNYVLYNNYKTSYTTL